jgi:hypothetical protein
MFETIDELFTFAENQKAVTKIEGMVKPSGNPATILYAPIGCEDWIPILRESG